MAAQPPSRISWCSHLMGAPRHILEPRPPPRRLSIVVPCHNESQVLPLLRARFEALPCQGLEFVLVNDGSTDETIFALVDWAKADPRAKVIHLARNFGHQAAVTAGLERATGDAIVIIDADLQDPPELIPEMVKLYEAGYDVVYGQRTAREGETAFKRLSAWIFYRAMRMLVQPDLPADAGDFRLISRRLLDALKELRETHRFLRGMVNWVGFPQVPIGYKRDARAAGETKYPLSKMLKFAWTAALSFSPAPLRLSFLIGLVMTLVGISYGIYAVWRVAMGLYVVPGWTSLIVSVCLIGGSTQLSLGILGEYVARIFEEAKGRPLYLVARTYNLDPP